MSFTSTYFTMLEDVNSSPDFRSSPRGLSVKENICYRFSLDNPLDRLPYIKDRNFSLGYMVGELLWYLSGNDSTDWIVPYSAFWKKISDDGVSANSAYGSRIFKPHPRVTGGNLEFNQWQYVIDELVRDPDSRRAVIHIRVPQDSYMAKLDVPCTLSLQFFLRNDKIHLTVSMRSSDVVLGIPYDVPAFTIFQELLSIQLTSVLCRPIGLGKYHHVSNSLHLYERDFGMVDKILSKGSIGVCHPMPRMPGLPPIQQLLEFENDARHGNDEVMMESLRRFAKGQDNYWVDWAIIIAAHWAKKRENVGLQKALLSTTHFEGYRFFDR